MKIQIRISDYDLQAITEFASLYEGKETLEGKKVTRNELIRIAARFIRMAYENPGRRQGREMAKMIDDYILE